MNHESVSREPWQTALKRVAIGVYFLGWLLLYDRVNRFASDPDRTFQVFSPADVAPWVIQPWTILIYVPGGLLCMILPYFYQRSWRGLRFVLLTNTLCTWIAFSCYALWPLSMARKLDLGRSWNSNLFRWLYQVDRPANCFPSFHAISAMLAVLFVIHGGASGKAIASVSVLALLVMISTITTGQHYFADAPAGAIVALLVFLSAKAVIYPPLPASASARN